MVGAANALAVEEAKSSRPTLRTPPISGPTGLKEHVVAGKFRLERVLAEGGMGIVFAATQLQLDRPVALKFVRADMEGVGAADAWESFLGEAKAAARLRSEHVAKVLDVGQEEEGAPYIVMEYLEGRSLADVLKIEGRLEIARVADYAIQVCEGLAEAHSCGIVHRDIKPDNLFLAEQGPYGRLIKILDFGISNMAMPRDHDGPVEQVVGSPPYMSPEQFQSGHDVDHRSDIWSLGVTLYELLTGSAPFPSSLPLPELVAAIRSRSPLPITHLRDDVPDEIAEIVHRCLAKDPNERFQSAADLARELVKFAPESARLPAQHAISMRPAAPFDSGPAAAKEQDANQEEMPLPELAAPQLERSSGIAPTQRSALHSPMRSRRTPRIARGPGWSMGKAKAPHGSAKRWAACAAMITALGAIAMGYRLERHHVALMADIALGHVAFPAARNK